MEPTAGVFVLLALAVALGTLIQGSLGFGFPLLVVPTMALVDPGYVPATVLLLGLPMAGLNKNYSLRRLCKNPCPCDGAPDEDEASLWRMPLREFADVLDGFFQFDDIRVL